MRAVVGPGDEEYMKAWYKNNKASGVYEKEKDMINAGYEIGQGGYERLLDAAWEKAVDQARRMSQLYGCGNCRAAAQFRCVDSDARRYAGTRCSYKACFIKGKQVDCGQLGVGRGADARLVWPK
jgi:hypothetical protein